MSMSEDDAAYSLLLAQLLSDSAPSRNARVHSWIEHQYDFAFSEQSVPAPSARPPSPSPSSSLGAHRAHSIDRPDSPLLPRFSSERPSSPCPSYDALFFPPPSVAKSEDQDFEEKERLRALRFIVQEMAHWKSQDPSRHTHDKPLPAPPPSPASSLTQSTSSRVIRSRSSSTRISRLPSFTSTLSSDQSQPHEIRHPPSASVIVHAEFQHESVLPHDRPLVDGYLHRRDDSLPHSLFHSQEQDGQFLCPIPDDKDSVQPSPTLSNFSCAYSRESSFTTPYGSSPTSPSSVVFSSSSCSPENIVLPASPIDDQPFFRDPITRSVHERTPSNQASPGPKPAFPLSPSLGSLAMSPPQTNVFPASPPSHSFSLVNLPVDDAPRRLRAPKPTEHSQSRWSVATTASLTPSTAQRQPSVLLDPRTPPKEKKDKGLKTPKKRTRFISLISRLSPGRTDASSTAMASRTGDDVAYNSADDSDIEDKEKNKRGKLLNKKSSLASLRASFSVSRASFNSQRPPMSFSIEEAPPLPMSPTLTSPVADFAVPSEVPSSFPMPSPSKIPSRANAINTPLPPIPQSASTITSFQSSSQVSISDTSAASASGSHVSLVCPSTTPSASRISLLPPPSKRTSLASAAGVEPRVTNPVTTNRTTSPSKSKSIFRLTAKPKSLKTPLSLGTKETVVPSRLPVVGNVPLPSPTTARSRIPQAPTKFNPPAKLVTVIATQSQQVPALVSPGPTSPTLKHRMPPSRPPPKAPRSVTTSEKTPAENLPSLPASSRLPMPASIKGARVGTVKGFWKRQ